MRIAITMGDPGGIGPEVAIKAACDPRVIRACEPVVIGDSAVLERAAGGPERTGRAGRSSAPTRTGGAAAGRAIEEAVRLALAGEVAGVVTAPVSKQSLALAGYGMVGHTEIIAGLTGARRYAMMMTSPRMRVVFVTTHLPLEEVARTLSARAVLEKIVLARDYLRRFEGARSPRIAVCGLNPHCGEGGALSGEERRVIEPAIRKARRAGIRAAGPYPAEVVFGERVAGGFAAIVAMYHDQGMIPIKMREPEEVVNITIGLPIVRTSPGHGTAFDIAGKGVADPRSMIRATLECVRLAKRLRQGDKRS
jgi:4-hydroxythreonine-4-phosphate dehydrogenase